MTKQAQKNPLAGTTTQWHSIVHTTNQRSRVENRVSDT